MDAYILFFLILFWGGLLLAIPIVLSFIIYRWLTKKGLRKVGLAVVFLIIGVFCYYIYISIYPPDGFYIDDFEYYSGLPFPESGRILAKDASFLDIHGTYSSDALIELSKTDFNNLYEKVSNDSTFKNDTIMCGEYYNKVTKSINTKSIIKIVQKGKLNIAFLNDNMTIIIEKRDYL